MDLWEILRSAVNEEILTKIPLALVLDGDIGQKCGITANPDI